MKRNWKTIATGMLSTLATLATTTFVACDKEDEELYIIDYSPVEIYIEPVDALGNNLMEQFKDKKITAE